MTTANANAKRGTAKRLDWNEGDYIVSEGEQVAFQISEIDPLKDEIFTNKVYNNKGTKEIKGLPLFLCKASALVKPATTNRSGITREYKPDFKNQCLDIQVLHTTGETETYKWIKVEAEPNIKAEYEAKKAEKEKAKAEKIEANKKKRDEREAKRAEKEKQASEKPKASPKAKDEPKKEPAKKPKEVIPQQIFG